jgi:hypothetical protein
MTGSARRQTLDVISRPAMHGSHSMNHYQETGSHDSFCVGAWDVALQSQYTSPILEHETVQMLRTIRLRTLKLSVQVSGQQVQAADQYRFVGRTPHKLAPNTVVRVWEPTVVHLCFSAAQSVGMSLRLYLHRQEAYLRLVVFLACQTID